MSSEQSVKKAAELLRQGASMLSESCPICNSPLYKLRSGEIVCPVHGKVIIARDEDEEKRLKRDIALDYVEQLLVELMNNVVEKLRNDPMNPDVILQVIRYLDSLERLKRVKDFARAQSK
ncbi:Sjogren's syndrome/scleroderma autoantigen 1 family protein [Metallosphaera hakonensis]|uniref:Uncharacterized protein n=1 Tax=Metallosphaera hakonensis JCM 8857 = DSM 7519 TaxID=1293036 RepID=A0A2U9IUN5_9CREN|nr:Sjogren's syndrome/scleroderma autoantigen 1 family protein [Metallosphaera hakonensis]AWR99692.1 hypothetical protein DFR87_08310 [Metallosphaera hakonensis JCM 8857 = DSM 7519]